MCACVCMCMQAGGREFKGRCMHMCGGGRVCAYVWGEEMYGDGRGARGGEVCSCMCGGGKEVRARRGGTVEDVRVREGRYM